MIINVKNKPVNIMFGSGVSSAKEYGELYPLIRTAIDCGIFAFDTAPSYRTEAVLGACLKRSLSELSLDREDLFIQTKIDALQMAEGGGKVEAHIMSAIKDLDAGYLDAVCIHWPIREYMNETWDAFLKARERGIVRYIGICNLRMRQLLYLPINGIIPDFIQIERHPLRICRDEISDCKAKDIAVQAYSPLCKMHKDIATNPCINGIASKYGKSTGQIVLKWHMDSGVVPIFTSKKIQRIQEYASLSDFSLTEDELERIDSTNKDYKMYLESCACPGY